MYPIEIFLPVRPVCRFTPDGAFWGFATSMHPTPHYENGNGVFQKALVKIGSRVLSKHGIDHKRSPLNMVWAPLYGEGIHGASNLGRVVFDLVRVQDMHTSRVIKVLQDHGRRAQQMMPKG